jgi:predicted small metal-binding protein
MMEKRLSCRDVGSSECDFVCCGKTEDEVLKKAGEHAKTAHGVKEMPNDLREKARSAIRDVDRC